MNLKKIVIRPVHAGVKTPSVPALGWREWAILRYEIYLNQEPGFPLKKIFYDFFSPLGVQ